MSEDGHDPWLDLCERFVARGVNLPVGSMQREMTRHLLDMLEEQDVRLRGMEDGYRKLKARLEALEAGATAESERSDG